MMVIAKYLCWTVKVFGSEAASPIQRGIVGMERRISMIRWITVSTGPP